MKKRIVEILILCISIGFMARISYLDNKQFIQMVNDSKRTDIITLIEQVQPTVEPSDTNKVGLAEDISEESLEEVEVVSEPLIFPDAYFDPNTEEYREEEFWDDMELVALVCQAEAEGDSEYGKRLVIDSVLNRVDSPYFPNTIYEVVYANNPIQYDCVYNGRINRVENNEYIANLVIEEYNNRTNSDVVYFRTDYFFSFGTPIVREGNHCFSGR